MNTFSSFKLKAENEIFFFALSDLFEVYAFSVLEELYEALDFDLVLNLSGVDLETVLNLFVAVFLIFLLDLYVSSDLTEASGLFDLE